MTQQFKNRQVPASNPLANVLVIIVGALAIGLSVILGFVAFVALAAVLLVFGAVIAIRIWWLNRRLPKSGESGPRSQQRRGTAHDAIEGEYQVVQDDDDPPQ